MMEGRHEDQQTRDGWMKLIAGRGGGGIDRNGIKGKKLGNPSCSAEEAGIELQVQCLPDMPAVV